MDAHGRVRNGVNQSGIGGNAARTISLWFNTPRLWPKP